MLLVTHRRRLGAESGVTLVEVLVASLLLAIGVVGTIGAFDGARKLNLRAEQRSAMAHRAQLELERLQTEPYAEIVMAAAPTHSTTTTNPDYYVSSSGTEYEYGTSSTEKAKLAVAGSTEKGLASTSPSGRECSKSVGACEWSDGNVKGNVYDFVTYAPDSKCETTESKCPKRLTVAVTASVAGGAREPTPLRMSTIVYQPE